MADAYDVTATAESSLMIGVGAESGHRVDGHAYIPGGVLLGALAAHWIRQHGPPQNANEAAQQQFVELFHSTIRFGPLLAGGSGFEPVSVLRHKYDSSRVWDRAFGKRPPAETPVEPGKGKIHGVTLTSSAHVQLESIEHGGGRNRERAADGNLFQRKALPARTSLQGRIVGQHRWLDSIRNELLWIGGRRSTGGRTRVTLTAANTVATYQTQTDEVVVRLTSPAIFIDDATRPAQQPSNHDLTAALGCGGAEVVTAWHRPITVGGWHAASGLPRPEEHAVAAGSTYLIRLPTDRTDDWHARLLRHGLGLRRNEGYGFVELPVGPWRAPTTETTEADSLSVAKEVYDDVRDLFDDDRMRRWIIDACKDLMVRRAASNVQGTTPDDLVTELRSRRRFEALSPSQREALSTIAEITDPAILSDLLVLLSRTQPPRESR